MANNWTSMVGGSYIYGAEANSDYFSNSNYKVINNPDLNGLNIRVGVRSGCFVRDKEIITDGFSKEENIGWVNIFKIC